jgi:hypothetical protein
MLPLVLNHDWSILTANVPAELLISAPKSIKQTSSSALRCTTSQFVNHRHGAVMVAVVQLVIVNVISTCVVRVIYRSYATSRRIATGCVAGAGHLVGDVAAFGVCLAASVRYWLPTLP